ncbi:MAG TPA: M28 family peptidase [Vicinamibacterales bacterium]|nr:M28 family peptidase [Vicinamibacterales bacterium]
MNLLRRCAAPIAAFVLSGFWAAALDGVGAQESARPEAQRPLPPSAERAYRAMAVRIDALAAMETVRYMDQYWRLAANPGFNASIDYIRARLLAAGFAESPEKNRPFVRVDEWGQARGWDYQLGTVAFADDGEIVLSRLRDRVSLCINSFSTPKGGVVARLVDVGDGGDAASYENVDVKGAVVLGNAEAGRLWQQAVKTHGAIGVISTRIAPYIRPADAQDFTSPDQQDVLQWSSVPYDADVKGFGFKASYRAAARLRERLQKGPVEVKVEIESSFYEGPTRTLVAEIPGAAKPDERIVLAAHVQEPGANDNSSGAGTLQAVAAALVDSARGRGLDRPARTLTFLWVDEIRGSRHWIEAYPDQVKNTQYMFSLDMTGEDTAKTGGTFLIEKQADPSAVWVRPSDPHTEWGAGSVKAESLHGSLLNDVHYAICLRRAKDTKWVVRTNPYEGGSDHTVFAEAGVPSLLNWHFTDRYYHTNLDRPDKTSPLEMLNVGVAVATSAWFLASADERDALAVVDLLSARADARLALEQTQGAAIVSAASDKAAAEATESAIIAAWRKWYGEALESVRRLPAGGSTSALDARIQQAQQRVTHTP